MHFDLKKAVGFTAIPLFGGVLAIGTTALPASAATWHDTALQASRVTQPRSATTSGAVVNGVARGLGQGSTLSFTAPRGERLASPDFSQGSTDATLAVVSARRLVLTSQGTATGTGTLTFTIGSTDSAVTCTAAETVQVSESTGTMGESSAPASVPDETVQVRVFNNNATGAVEFTGIVSGASCTVTFSQGNLPAGLVSGNPLVPGSAVPQTYDRVVYRAADPLGSTYRGTFELRVYGQVVRQPGNYGNEVNRYGNGFDAYKQHQYPGAVVAGWTATQADPATHFIRTAGTHQGAYRFEYAPHGAASGLCVSDPGGGWSQDPLRDGLILTPCNTGPWQQFIPQPGGTLRNVATGLYVNPDGTGAQLRGGTAPTSWGGSVYTWTGYSQLPG